MRKPIWIILFACISVMPAVAQKIDSATISNALIIAGLNFTAAEKDSMADGLKDNLKTYEGLRKQPIPNDLAYPFGFQPALGSGRTTGMQKETTWRIPANTVMPANKEDLAFYSIPQLASLLRAKKISSVELTRFFIGRLKKWGDTLQCVITITEELAMKEAAAADEELKKGKWRGALHGIPYGLKDLFAVKGYKTTWGSVPYKDQVIEENAFVYEQLRKAGAVLCAKLTLGELAYGDQWFGGKTKNPWNTTYGSSGSSAGSASATAAGLLPFAIGTETWGSIISPSHTCGVTGLRPTFGSVSRTGAMVLSWSLDKVGPITRSAEDAAIVFYYIKGTDGKDPSATEHAFNFTAGRDIKKLRIAYAENYFKRLGSVSLQSKVLDQLRAMGANIVAVDFPDSTIYPYPIMDPIISAESAAAFDELTRSNMDDLIRRQDKNFWPNSFRVARLIPAVEYINANRHRSLLMQQMKKFMENYDVVIVPTYGGNQLAMTNLTGHPALCIPVGFLPNGTPASITFLGNLYDEASLLELANAFQGATDHHRKHPEKFTH
ncbi:amidase [Flavihumibacter sp. ZG627]|uniref:amidase n=1 Tax=Flavihumibacter sp. ZG627 TaxID=1463156 RepID=UPI00058004DB|nr:amidase [Flavihumibacter sp. ZG627]KIC91418.1 hypothetical protein HY58_03990 [Flavihumibacter sp. ZG627]